MLDLDAPVARPGLPDIAIFRDDGIASGFYAWSKAPRVTNESGRYDMRFVVYGKEEAGAFVPSGGLLALTTAIELTAEEQQRARASLVEYLNPSATPAQQPLIEPQFLSPEFVDGTAELRLSADCVITGKPSLYAGNRCVFSVNIDGATIDERLRAWDARLEGATVAYALRVRARPAQALLNLSGPVMPVDAVPGEYVTKVAL